MHATREREKLVTRQEIEMQLDDLAADREEVRRQATIQGEKPDGSGIFTTVADYDNAIRSIVPDLTANEQQVVTFVRLELERQEASLKKLTEWDNAWRDSYDDFHGPDCYPLD
jgi:hypothetical protein